MPPPPDGLTGNALSREARHVWESFWTSSVALAIDRLSDLPQIERWIQLWDERERISKLVANKPLTTGSMGQLRMNPLSSYLKDITSELRDLQEGFGLTPRSRFRLGIEAADANDALTSMQRELDRLASHDEEIPEEFLTGVANGGGGSA